MEDDNIFDKDDALDYVMYEEVNKEKHNGAGKSGCFGVVVLMILPIVGLGVFLLRI